MEKVMVEYIWIDGSQHTAKLRSKNKIVDGKVSCPEDLPDWGFDGSSTMQAEGHFSDCLLKPVHIVKDPLRGGDNILVMCEVFNADGSVHISNKRAKLRELAEKHNHHPDIIIGYCIIEISIFSHQMNGVTTKCVNLATAINTLQNN